MKSRLKRNLTILALAISTSPPASAYLDPGTMSLVLQGALAILAGGIATLRIWREKLFGWRKKRPPGVSTTIPDSENARKSEE